jgi:hypothetical protein
MASPAVNFIAFSSILVTGNILVKNAHLAQRASGQPLQNRQQEGSGLTSAGLRQPQYVAPFEHDGDSLMLNRGGRSVTSRLDARADARVEQMEEPKLA